MDSPQSIAQAARDGVALARLPELSRTALRASAATATPDGVLVKLHARLAGAVHLFSWDGDKALGDKKVELAAGEKETVTVPASEGTPSSVLIAFSVDDATLSQAVPVHRIP